MIDDLQAPWIGYPKDYFSEDVRCRTADLTLYKEELIDYNLRTGDIRVHKGIFNDFVPNKYVDVQFVEDKNAIYRYIMRCEDDDSIFMEYGCCLED